ncbi:MAG: RDD family protein [Planctomycetota bacterium]
MTVPRLPAPLLSRGFAYLLDCTIAFAVFAVVQLFALLPLRESIGITDAWFHSGWNTELYTLLTISLPVWMYFALFESWRGATPGKRLSRIRVLDVWSGEGIGFGRALLRTLVKLLPWELAHLGNNLPEPMWYAEDPGLRVAFALSGLMLAVLIGSVLLSKSRRGLHDLAARSLVVSSKELHRS